MSKVLVMPVIGQHTDAPGDAADIISEVYQLWCPACTDGLRLNSTWGFNGDVDRPSFKKEIYTVVHDRICHATITDGVWHYHEDSTHDQAGKDLPAVDVPAITLDPSHV